MKGRVMGFKKTWFLRSIALCCALLFVGLTCFAFLKLKIPNLWFYSFCLGVGIYELSKGLLFRFDSALYFGLLMTNIGASGYIFYLCNLREYAVFFIAISFIIASILTFVLCQQRFHLILAYSITFLSLYGFLFAKKLISTPILIAFILLFLIQLVVSITLNIKKGI